jgi:hypothetical protein
MGSMADDIIDGVFCDICGEYIGEPVGYPRTCSGCQVENDEERDFDTKDDLIAEGYEGEI